MIAKCYFELRKSSNRGDSSIWADCMRHLQTRQHLGKAIIICEEPATVLSVARKQWLKLARSLQKQRASTLNADKILKYTHTITRMQHMTFSTKDPLEQPNADVYFLKPADLSIVPVHCWSVYVLHRVWASDIRTLCAQLPTEALIIDYTTANPWQQLGIRPKKLLEAQAHEEWLQVQRFLHGHHIDAAKLIENDIHNVEAMDDALDTLLGGPSHQFMQLAGQFQRALELARPLRLSKDVRTSYDAVVLLAHRVQALTPGAFTQHFLETYNENDTFFLYDHRIHRRALLGTETLAEAFARHTQAGRHHLARSLHLLAGASA